MTDAKITATRRSEARVYRLPGRDWALVLAPQNSPSRNLTLSIATFPPGSAPAGHVHQREEEMVYVLAGRGRVVVGASSIALEPGVAFFVPPGLEHGAVCEGDAPLELLCVFSPPVVPGSYDPQDTKR